MLQATPQALITDVLDASAKLHVLHRDFETRSRAVLKTVGACPPSALIGQTGWIE